MKYIWKNAKTQRPRSTTSAGKKFGELQTTTNDSPRSHDPMTKGCKKTKDIYTIEKKPARNKTTNSDGVPYENRNSHWAALDKAAADEGIIIGGWLLPERIKTELSILNPPGKKGRPYLYPPSLILYIM